MQTALSELAHAQYLALLGLYDQQGVITAEELRTRQVRVASVGEPLGALGRDSAGVALGRDTPFPATMLATPGGMQPPQGMPAPMARTPGDGRFFPPPWPMRASVRRG